jgi:hypothetical protein
MSKIFKARTEGAICSFWKQRETIMLTDISASGKKEGCQLILHCGLQNAECGSKGKNKTGSQQARMIKDEGCGF